MAESSLQIPSLPKITPKEEPDTQDRPESPNHFLPADQVEEAFTSALTQYVEYLAEFWYTAKTFEDSKIWVSTPIGGIRGEIGITTFKNTLRAHYLPHSSKYVFPPSLAIVRSWFAMIGYNREIGAKGTLKKSCLPPRRKQSSKHTSESKTEASKSKTDQLDKRTQSSLAKEKRSSHPSAPTPVVAEMHKEAQQATGGPTSLGATSEEGAHPQLTSGMSAFIHIEPIQSASFTFHSESASGCDALADSTAEADPRKSAPNDSIPLQYGMDEGTKNYSIDYIFASTNPSVFVNKTKFAGNRLETANTYLCINEDLDSLVDKLIIVSNKSDTEETQRHEDTHATFHDETKHTSVPPPLPPKSVQLQELLAQVAEIKTIQWELPAEFLVLPNQISSVQEKLKTLDALPSKSNVSLAEGEKNTYSATKEANLKNDLVDLMGIDVVEEYHKKKLLEDETIEVISNFKKRMEYLNQTEKELKIDFNKPLKEQDPLNKLNELANKKRKRTDDLKDHSRSTKKHKSSVQHEEESLSSKEITPQLSFNHLVILQARQGFEVDAKSEQGAVAAVDCAGRRFYGLQCHPESQFDARNVRPRLSTDSLDISTLNSVDVTQSLHNQFIYFRFVDNEAVIDEVDPLSPKHRKRFS
ncbi:retrovirus-related pol polyprotein from transposon TNT 1-94 [Tanacetum coccineum]|uniref:Retrovirus-related pol polyprotein from transposon TNT 1-94 n=1 Tax=Tanacetum coccineum TaxID=301880 RepID=A0ABQ5AJA4_9ASTR